MQPCGPETFLSSWPIWEGHRKNSMKTIEKYFLLLHELCWSWGREIPFLGRFLWEKEK